MATGAAGKLNFMADATLESTSRERFLVAADEQFIESGYDRCTIRAIAARAGTQTNCKSMQRTPAIGLCMGRSPDG